MNYRDKSKLQYRKASKFEDIEVKDAKRPYSDKKVDSLISVKALRGLPRSGSSITPKVDPYTQVLPSSDPYALLNAMNRAVGGNYGGLDNLDGGNTRQYMTSEKSGFLHAYDSFYMQLPTNYRYLPIADDDTTRGKGLPTEMIKAIDEILSLASATTFTALGAYNYTVETDIPTGDFTYPDGGFPGGSAEGIYAWAVHYQIILQSIASCFAVFNKHRNNMGEMMRMSWNRETPRLNSYFGLLKKKSFLSMWDALGYTVEGEYFDYDWMKQFNMIASMASRRANDVIDPVLEIGCFHVVPSLKLSIKNGSDTTVIYDSSEMDTIMRDACANLPLNNNITNFEGAISLLNQVLSINDTLFWARGGLNNPTAQEPLTEQERFRTVTGIMEGLVACMNYFKPRMSDLRTLLDVLGRVSVNRWSKNVGLKVVSDTDLPLFRNLTVEHIYQMVGGGSTTMEYNDTTYRWSSYTPWNIYTGIPEYDSKSGGAFLSLSTKTLSYGSESSAIYYLPVIFDQPSSIVAVNRLGDNAVIEVQEIQVNKDSETRRLAPLPEMDFKIRVPVIPYTGIVSGKPDDHVLNASFLRLACNKIFNISAYEDTNGTSFESVDVNDDILCYVSYEIEDLSNEMIAYCRANGPFSVNVLDAPRMGFLGLDSI